MRNVIGKKVTDYSTENNNMSEIYIQRPKLHTWWGRERTG